MSDHGTAVINIIDKFRINTGSQTFRCIMIYRDLDSDFCFIRPLLDKIELEIVMELFKMFTTFGAPRALQLTSGAPTAADSVRAQLRALCPMFELSVVKHNTQDYLSAMKVVTKLREWMTQTEQPEWEVGCAVVQNQLNHEPSAGSGLTPHQRFFRGLTTSTTTTQQRTNTVTQPKTYSRQVPPQNDAPSLNSTQTQELSEAPTDEVKPIATQVENFKQPEMSKTTNSTEVTRIPELNSRSLLRQSIDAIRVKEEPEEPETGLQDRSRSEGGLDIPGLKTEPLIEIKVEAMDE